MPSVEVTLSIYHQEVVNNQMYVSLLFSSVAEKGTLFHFVTLNFYNLDLQT